MPDDFNRETEFFSGLAKLIPCTVHKDDRGVLQPFYFDQMPFIPCRSFTVSDMPADTVRGGHAHRAGMQMFVCLQGRIEILMRHQDEEVALVMEPSSYSLVFGPNVWCQQKYINEGAVLLVFASHPYNPESYLEHWNEAS